MTLGRGLAAWTAAAAIVLGSPVVGDLRQLLLRSFPGHYVVIVAGAVVLGSAVLLLACLRRIRDRRLLRVGALSAAVALAAVCFAVLRSGNANVDAVESFHFVEYGALTLLFFRSWRPGPRWEAYARSALAGLVVAIGDEWFQWFVPGRVGELHDVLFDFAAIACGLLLCVAASGRGASSRGRQAGRYGLAVGVQAACVVLLLGAFVATVHLGSEIRDHDVGTFRSRFSAARLLELGEARRRLWAGGPPPSVGDYGREDQYVAEALWHVRRRNFGMDKDRHGDTAELDVAWNENRILEKYFGPVLEAPPAPGTSGHRLAPEQIAALDAARAHGGAPFVSDAEAAPIYTWPPARFWTVVVVAALSAVVTGLTFDRRAGHA